MVANFYFYSRKVFKKNKIIGIAYVNMIVMHVLPYVASVSYNYYRMRYNKNLLLVRMAIKNKKNQAQWAVRCYYQNFTPVRSTLLIVKVYPTIKIKSTIGAEASVWQKTPPSI